MAKKTTGASQGESINHFNAVRMRLKGIGNLKLTLESLGDEEGNPLEIQELIDIPMVPATNIQPTRLANFKQMRARLRFETTEFGEFLNLTRLVIFSKRVATGYPGNRMS